MKNTSNVVTVVSPITQYLAGDLIGETKTFSLYSCILSGERPGILKIATSLEHNPKLDREAYILNNLKTRSDFVKTKNDQEDDKKGDMGYGKFFPFLEETFVSAEQLDRRINILDLSHVCTNLTDLAPIGRLLTKEHIRVDPKTSAWFMGKLLKMLDFVHHQGITAKIDSENILINKDRHVVMIFDWTESTISNTGKIEDTSINRKQIADAAREVILALGGDIKTGIIPSDDQLPDDEYQKILWNLSNGMEKSAARAHLKFYEYIGSIWPDEFYPFTAYTVD